MPPEDAAQVSEGRACPTPSVLAMAHEQLILAQVEHSRITRHVAVAEVAPHHPQQCQAIELGVEAPPRVRRRLSSV